MTAFVAIDFETANEQRCSACAVGLSRFDDEGNLVDSFYTLLHPHPEVDYFNPVNIWVHGIKAADVIDAPQWNEVYEQIQKFIGEDPIVAHNMAFDGYVLSDLTDLYQLAPLTNRRFCTVRLSRRLLADKLERKTLDRVYSYYFPEDSFTHHRASDDSLACGRIFARMLSEYGYEEIATLCPEISQRSSSSHPGMLSAQIEAEDLIKQYGDSNCLAGERVSITGTLQHGKRAAIGKLITAVGGVFEKNLTKRTTILVVGIPNPRSWVEGASDSRKMAKAAQLRAAGAEITVLTEEDFFHRLEEK